MRIDPNLVVLPVSSESQKPKAASTPPSQSSVVALSSAGVAVSAAPDDISAAQTAKIARLRNAVETGTYKVDLETLASRIVDDEVMREGATKS